MSTDPRIEQAQEAVAWMQHEDTCCSKGCAGPTMGCPGCDGTTCNCLMGMVAAPLHDIIRDLLAVVSELSEQRALAVNHQVAANQRAREAEAEVDRLTRAVDTLDRTTDELAAGTVKITAERDKLREQLWDIREARKCDRIAEE